MPIKLRSNWFCLATAVLFIHAVAVHAQLFSIINYNQAVTLDAPSPYGQVTDSDKFLTGATLPVNQTPSLNSYGSSSAATYVFADNGTTASYDIAFSFNSAILDVNAMEGTFQAANGSYVLSSTYFEFSQPVNYSVFYQNRVSGLASAGGYIGMSLGNTTGIFYGGGENATYQASGTLLSGMEYSFTEYSGAFNGYSNDTTVNGSTTINLTFTAIPEPTPIAILSAFPILLLKRRRSL